MERKVVYWVVAAMNVSMLIPQRLRDPARRVYFRARNILLRGKSRPISPAETSKARERREQENFFSAFCTGRGLDIGYGGDPITPDCDVWDTEHGNAEILSGIPDGVYNFVYSSHTLEHLPNPTTALTNWWRVLKVGGFLILYVPHRNYYEKKGELPSRWNPDHKFFLLPEKDDPPDTLGLKQLIEQSLQDFDVIYLKECTEGFTIVDPAIHSDGEYSIEAVIQKK